MQFKRKQTKNKPLCISNPKNSQSDVKTGMSGTAGCGEMD